MGHIKTSGVVIKEVNTGEADKIITIFSRNKGKIIASAKGARRAKSSLVAGVQLLCYSDFVLFKGRDMYSVSSTDVVESFYEIRNDLVRLTYAAHINEIIYDTVQENQPSTKVLQLFLNCLYLLAKTDKSPEQITRIFEIRLLSILGYSPFVDSCMMCNDEDVSNMYFSFIKCGFLCKKCYHNDKTSMNISEGTAKALQYIIHSNIKNLFNFEVSENVLIQLKKISKRYLKDRLEKNYNKLDYLKNIE